MKAFWVQMNDLDLFSDISRDVAMATILVKNSKLPSFVALHSKMEWDIATSICA